MKCTAEFLINKSEPQEKSLNFFSQIDNCDGESLRAQKI
jgi:hypothetical protein